MCVYVHVRMHVCMPVCVPVCVCVCVRACVRACVQCVHKWHVSNTLHAYQYLDSLLAVSIISPSISLECRMWRKDIAPDLLTMGWLLIVSPVH